MTTDSHRYFIDTNILVYAHDVSASEKHEKAKTLVSDLWKSRNGCLSIQVLQEFYVTVVNKVSVPLRPETASAIIKDLAQWLLHIPDANDILEAINIQQRNKLSFWDSMVIRSASVLNCSFILSEDLNSGQSCEKVTIVNPFIKEVKHL
jgi:predicted nucleic acid-binding protein